MLITDSVTPPGGADLVLFIYSDSVCVYIHDMFFSASDPDGGLRDSSENGAGSSSHQKIPVLQLVLLPLPAGAGSNVFCSRSVF